MRKKILAVFKHWLPLVFLGTTLCGLIYLSGQQNIRQGANDPQIQLSEDFAGKLLEGQTIPLNFSEKIDPSLSISPFVIVYDEEGKVVNSSAEINGKTPIIPSGVLDYTKIKGEHRFTWQTKEGVRIATVITYYKGGSSSGFVLAGKSLREVEIREDQLMWEVFSIWIFSLAGLLFLGILLNHSRE